MYIEWLCPGWICYKPAYGNACRIAHIAWLRVAGSSCTYDILKFDVGSLLVGTLGIAWRLSRSIDYALTSKIFGHDSFLHFKQILSAFSRISIEYSPQLSIAHKLFHLWGFWVHIGRFQLCQVLGFELFSFFKSQYRGGKYHDNRLSYNCTWN